MLVFARLVQSLNIEVEGAVEENPPVNTILLRLLKLSAVAST
jgi:hypothetical protein